MYLLDEHQQILYDGETAPGERLRSSILKSGMFYTHAAPQLLYRFSDEGDLYIVDTSQKKFCLVVLPRKALDTFKRQGRVATDSFVVRDTGCKQSRVYLDTYSFTVPTELLLR